MIPSKKIEINTSRHMSGAKRNMFANPTNIRKDYHMASSDNRLYHRIDDFDNPNSWDLKELDMMEGMGFQIEGDCRMSLAIPGDMEMNKYEVAKHKKLGYELRINERKHYFKTFDKMMEKIDEFGKLDV